MKIKFTSSKSGAPVKGFTLVEMTLVMVVGIIIAVMSLTLFNYQLMAYKIIGTQNFLIHEAPQVNNTLNRIVSRANFFRLYPTLNDAETGQNATITDAKVLALKFNGTTQADDSFGVIAFDASNNQVTYYHLDSLAELANAGNAAWRAQNSWNISNQVNDAVFYVENGVLRTKITGPNGAEIIHSTTTQR